MSPAAVKSETRMSGQPAPSPCALPASQAGRGRVLRIGILPDHFEKLTCSLRVSIGEARQRHAPQLRCLNRVEDRPFDRLHVRRASERFRVRLSSNRRAPQ